MMDQEPLLLLKYKHIIFTRFNVGVYTHGIFYRNCDDGCSTDVLEWMYTRSILLSELTYNGLKQQSNKHFEWVVIVDSNTPPEMLSFIYEFEDIDAIVINVDHEFVVNHYLEYPEIRDYLNTFDIDTLITTNCDSDTFLSSGYVERVQNFKNTDKLTLDVPISYDLTLVDGELVNITCECPKKITSSNSLIEEYSDNLVTVGGMFHYMFGRSNIPIQFLNNEYMISVHGDTNVNYRDYDDRLHLYPSVVSRKLDDLLHTHKINLKNGIKI